MTHTPEPWRVRDDVTSYANWISAENDHADIAELSDWGPSLMHEQEANAARIVSCVNGCAGLNPDAYREVVEALEAIVGFVGFSPENIEAGYAALAKARAV